MHACIHTYEHTNTPHTALSWCRIKPLSVLCTLEPFTTSFTLFVTTTYLLLYYTQVQPSTMLSALGPLVNELIGLAPREALAGYEELGVGAVGLVCMCMCMCM